MLVEDKENGKPNDPGARTDGLKRSLHLNTSQSSPVRDGVSKVYSPRKEITRLPCGKLITMTVSLTIENVSPDDVNRNPRMQRLLCDSVAKAAHLSSDLIRLKDTRAQPQVLAELDRVATDVDFLITAPLSCFPEHADPLDRVLQLLTSDPFLAPTGPTVQDNAENCLAAAVKRCKSEAFRGLGLRQSSGIRSKSTERTRGVPRSRSRSGSATRPTIFIEEKTSTGLGDQFKKASPGTNKVDNANGSLLAAVTDDSPIDERRRAERDAFRLRLAAASKETANRMKKTEWKVAEKRLRNSGAGSASISSANAQSKVSNSMESLQSSRANDSNSSFVSYAGRFFRTKAPKPVTQIPLPQNTTTSTKSQSLSAKHRAPFDRRASEMPKASKSMASPTGAVSTERISPLWSSPEKVDTVVENITSSSPIKGFKLRKEEGLSEDVIRIHLVDEVRRVSVNRARVIGELTTILERYNRGKLKRSKSFSAGTRNTTFDADISADLVLVRVQCSIYMPNMNCIQVSELGAPSPYSTPQDMNASKEYLRGLHTRSLENDKSMDIEEFMGFNSAVKSPTLSPVAEDHDDAVSQVDRELENRIQRMNSMTLAQENQRLQFEKEQSERAYLEALRLEQEKATALRLEVIKQEKLAAEKERQEAIRIEQQKAEAARELAIQMERERIEQVYRQQLLTEQKRAEELRLEAIRVERERAEMLRQQAIHEEREKAEELRLEIRKQEKEKAEKARLAAERIEREREELERLEREAQTMAQQLQKETSSRLRSLTASSSGRDKERRRSLQQSKAELEASSRAAIKEREELLMKEKAAEDERRRLALAETERAAKEKERLEAQALLEAERLLALKRGVQARLKKKELQLQESLKVKAQTRLTPTREEFEVAEVNLASSNVEILPEAHALCQTHSYAKKGRSRRLILVFVMAIAAFWTYSLLSLDFMQRSALYSASHHSLEMNIVEEFPILEQNNSELDVLPSMALGDNTNFPVIVEDYDTLNLNDGSSAAINDEVELDEMHLNNTLQKTPRWSFRRVIIQVVKLPLLVVRHSIVFAFGLA